MANHTVCRVHFVGKDGEQYYQWFPTGRDIETQIAERLPYCRKVLETKKMNVPIAKDDLVFWLNINLCWPVPMIRAGRSIGKPGNK